MKHKESLLLRMRRNAYHTRSPTLNLDSIFASSHGSIELWVNYPWGSIINSSTQT